MATVPRSLTALQQGFDGDTVLVMTDGSIPALEVAILLWFRYHYRRITVPS
jgi:hypothetical protein